jgi:hypothetical protein
MREAQRTLIRACIEEDANMPFDDIVLRTGLSSDRVSELLADVTLENGSITKFFNDDLNQDAVTSPWDLAIDDELLEKYKKEIDDKTNKIKPLIIMKMYMELESDKRIAQDKLNKLRSSPHQGSRWLELKLKARNEQIKLLGLDAAEKLDISIGVSRTKQERDEIFKAAQARNLLPAGVV